LGQSSAWEWKTVISSWEEEYIDTGNEIDAHGKGRTCWIILKLE